MRWTRRDSEHGDCARGSVGSDAPAFEDVPQVEGTLLPAHRAVLRRRRAAVPVLWPAVCRLVLAVRRERDEALFGARCGRVVGVVVWHRVCVDAHVTCGRERETIALRVCCLSRGRDEREKREAER